MNKTPTAATGEGNAPRVTCVEWRCGGVTDKERITNLQSNLRNEVNAHVQVIRQRDELLAALKLAEVYVCTRDKGKFDPNVQESDAHAVQAAIAKCERGEQ